MSNVRPDPVVSLTPWFRTPWFRWPRGFFLPLKATDPLRLYIILTWLPESILYL